MERTVKPEILDNLPASDPRAVGSRRDLRRLNARMKSADLIAAAVAQVFPRPNAVRLLEIGAGDGTLLAEVAGKLGAPWAGTNATLLDRQPVVAVETLEVLADLGWSVSVIPADLLDWIHRPGSACDLILSNLFLHHFDDERLGVILAGLAARTRVLLALEPHRCFRFRLVARFLWLMGCNHVTRHDAKASVRAGFRDRELTRLWPVSPEWRIEEGPAGWFNHRFLAWRSPG